MPDLTATQDDVRAAYRLILDRDPDPGGLADYATLIRDKPITTRHLLARFQTSEESRIKHAGVQIDIGGIVAFVDPSEPEFGRTIARDNAWEPHILETIKANLAPGQVFVDIGANLGVMSFTAARIVGDRGKVIAFEPDDQNARFFLRGLIANGFQQFVRLHRLALSDRSDVFALEGGSNASLIDPGQQNRLVQSVPGDELLGNEPAIHFIKIDIEGHEPFALRGLAQTLWRHKPLVLCEFNPRCLTDHANIPPIDFARQIFDLTHAVQVIEHDGRITHVSAANALMDLWSTKNHQAARAGFLPEGMLHFDLLFRAAT